MALKEHNPTPAQQADSVILSCLRRYQRGSEMCEKLGKALDHLTNSEDRELFDFGKRAGEASPLVRTTY